MTKTHRLSILSGIVALVLIAAGVLYAQGGRDGMMGMMERMRDCPMMLGTRESPAAVLEHREELALTDDQVQQLERLRQSAAAPNARRMERMKTLHQEIRAATEGETFDETAARAAFDRMGALHTEMGVAMLRARHEARQVLTLAQREKLSGLGGGMMGMHGMMGGMMDDCPMMQHGTTAGPQPMQRGG